MPAVLSRGISVPILPAAFIVNRYYYTISNMFTFSDVVLLARKIAVGILLTFIPFVLIAGGIWLAWKLFI
ncbi:hypothetical protein GCM10007423_36340 [Dyadobacter endophyticus]|uniref:Uncharacterized protein n=1 Tax=Dyadobacter endophyticus TaxID=1749036 RepID=A0ABQ1YYC6_9BACT|nr:hypothetical protein GCM10007423_36340 [Dyadobacter endophyticus]